jgi:hypothetical protein
MAGFYHKARMGHMNEIEMWITVPQTAVLAPTPLPFMINGCYVFVPTLIFVSPGFYD